MIIRSCFTDLKNIDLNNLRDKDYLSNCFLHFYSDLNKTVYKKKLFGSEWNESDVFAAFHNIKLTPLFPSQMGVVFNINPIKYSGMLTDGFINLLIKRFRKNMVFLLSDDGFLVNILITFTDKEDRTIINNYVANNIDELIKYQYYTTEIPPYYEYYKPLTALLKFNSNKNWDIKDILLTFQ